MRHLLLVLFLVALAAPVNAATRCYGPKEKALAQELLAKMPLLRQKLDTQRREARFVRNETCGTIAAVGRLVDIDYAERFFSDSGWSPLFTASRKRHLDPLRVQAAMVDLHWAPKKRREGLHASR